MKLNNVLLIFVCSLISSLLFTSKAFAEELNLPPSATINVYEAPRPVLALNKAYLVYELYVTNYAAQPLVLTSLDVSGDDFKHFKLSKEDLAKSILAIKPDDKKSNSLTLQPGEAKIFYLWFAFDNLSKVPNKLKHEFIFKNGSINTEYTINKTPAVIISAPLKGANWLIGNGLSNFSVHRRSAVYFDGRPYFSERYAVDLVILDKNSKTFKGDVNKNKSYYCYNQDVLAVAKAKVVQVKDGIPENIPHSDKYAAPMNVESMGGNYIILDLGEGRFASYAHLIPGSIKVKVGDKVKPGQVLAKLGNSGHSSEPHLHFQISDKPSMLKSNGLPFGFDHFDLIPTREEPDRLMFLKVKPIRYENQIALENSLIDFGL